MNLSILIAMVAGIFSALLINYFADILPVTRKLSRPVCRTCKNPFIWVDYILNRSCKVCLDRRSSRTLFVYIACILLTGVLWIFPPVIGFWFGLLIITYFGVVIVIDIEHRLVMHPVSISGAVIGGAIGIWQHGIPRTLIGGSAGFLIMLILYYLGIGFVRLISKKRKMVDLDEAIGFGDVTLSGVMGLFLGWPGVIAGILFTIVCGGIVSLILLIVLLIKREYKAYSSLPYAPFIALSAIVLLLLVRN